MKIWFTHHNETFTTEDNAGSVLPILDLNDQQHIVRWGATVGDDNRFLRGMWYSESSLNKFGATWVRIPALRYRQNTMYGDPKTIELDEPLAGGLFRIPGAGARVFLAVSNVTGETTVVPLRFSQLTTPRNH